MSGIVGTIGANSGVIGKNETIWGPNDKADLTLGTGVTLASDAENGLWKNDLTGIATCYFVLDDFSTSSNQALFTVPAGYYPQADYYVAAVCTCWDAAYMCRFYGPASGNRLGEVYLWHGDYVGKGEGGRTSTDEGIIFSHTWLTA